MNGRQRNGVEWFDVRGGRKGVMNHFPVLKSRMQASRLARAAKAAVTVSTSTDPPVKHPQFLAIGKSTTSLLRRFAKI
jgi:hypothetical protein